MGAAPLLSVEKDGEVIKTCALTEENKEFVLGRGEGCVIRLEDRAISRQHAVFRRTSEGLQVEKKSEFAPLVINGKDMTRAMVKEGDVIELGPYLVKLTLPESASGSSAALSQTQVNSATAVLPPLAEPPENAGEPALSLPENDGRPLAPLEDPGAPAVPTGLAAVPGAEAQPGFDPQAVGLPELQPQEGNPESPGMLQPLEQPEAPAAAEPAPVEIADSDAATKVAPLGNVIARLTFKPGTANVETFELRGQEISIGRAKSCDIVLNDKKASRKNTIIRKAGLNYVVKDLNSVNGTYLNGAKISEQELTGEDVIQVGDVEFKFVIAAADYTKRMAEYVPVDVAESPDAVQQVPDISKLLSDNAGMSGSAANALMSAEGFVPAGAQVPVSGAVPGAIPGLTGVSGIAGVGASGGGGLAGKWRSMTNIQKIATVAILLLVGDYAADMIDPPATGKKKDKAQPVATASAIPGKPMMRSFEQLTKDQKEFVKSKRALAQDHFTNQDFDNAIFAVDEILKLVDDYQGALEVKRYAVEGQRRLAAREEEKRKKEEEIKRKAEIAELTEEIRGLMQKKDYEKARDAFARILERDPDNTDVTVWKKEIENWEEEQRIKEQQAQVRDQVNQNAWDIFKEANSRYRAQRYHDSLRSLAQLDGIGFSDKKLSKAKEALLRKNRAAVRAIREPLLAEARQLEEAGDLGKAYQLYYRATQADPGHKEGYRGMNRLRSILHDRAKVIYTEAILAESYSDFETAKKRYRECLEVAPRDDIYYERAERKLVRFTKKEEVAQ